MEMVGWLVIQILNQLVALNDQLAEKCDLLQ